MSRTITIPDPAKAHAPAPAKGGLMDGPLLLDRRGVARLLGLGCSSVDLLRKRPGFPAPINAALDLPLGSPRWSREQIVEWVRARRSA